MIYEFVIAPVKWPYYFVTTRFVVNFLRKRGFISAKLPPTQVAVRTKEAVAKKMVTQKEKVGDLKEKAKKLRKNK